MHYVIIGNSAAAIGAVEGIRERDRENPITLISSEPHHTYSRPLISYYLAKKVLKDKMLYRPKDFYQKNLVNPLLGRRVLKLELERESLILDGDVFMPYNRLLLATGGTPFIPPIKGLRGLFPAPATSSGKAGNEAACPEPSLESRNIFTFTTWDDAQKVAEVAKKGSRALIIGGGLIGLKACEGLLALGVKVTVVELAERLLITALDAKGSQIMLKHLKSLGVKVILGNTVEEITAADHGSHADSLARLKDGTEIEWDFVILAIGVRPNLELVEGTPILTNRGIVVNEFMETSVPGIFAAGDVAEIQDMIYAIKRVIPIWPNAYRQGKIAGMNMVQRNQGYSGSLGMNSIEICGLPTISVGMIDAPTNGYKEYKNIIQINSKQRSYRRFVIRGNRLIAAIMVGDISKAGIFTSLITDSIPLNAIKHELGKDDFGYISFPVEMRKDKLLSQ